MTHQHPQTQTTQKICIWYFSGNCLVHSPFWSCHPQMFRCWWHIHFPCRVYSSSTWRHQSAAVSCTLFCTGYSWTCIGGLWHQKCSMLNSFGSKLITDWYAFIGNRTASQRLKYESCKNMQSDQILQSCNEYILIEYTSIFKLVSTCENTWKNTRKMYRFILSFASFFL